MWLGFAALATCRMVLIAVTYGYKRESPKMVIDQSASGSRITSVWLWSKHALPISLVAALVVVDRAWNASARIFWELPIWEFLLPAILFAISAAIFKRLPFGTRLPELSLYLCIWTFFSIFGLHLTYLAATLDLPLRDAALARADQMLGFDWRNWHNDVVANGPVLKTLILAYESFSFEPIAIIAILALSGRGSNREFLLSAIFALVITTVLFAVLPAYGPDEAFGDISRWHPILDQLRAGQRGPMDFAGIITFPSFHACLALLYTIAVRGSRAGFLIVGAWNLLVLISCVPLGNHYLVDVIAGCCVAVIAWLLAKLMPANPTNAWQTEQPRRLDA